MRYVPVWALLLMLSASLAPSTVFAQGKGSDQPRDACPVDDEALPEGALFRLGTLRFQHFGEISFAHSRDSRHLLTVVSDEGRMRTWDVLTGRALSERLLPEVLPGPLFAISPDGKTLAQASLKLSLWSAEKGTLLAEVDGTGDVGVVFSADGNTVLTLDEDGVVSTIDIRKKSILGRTVLEKFPEKIQKKGEAAFGCNGRTVAGFSGDDNIRLWDTATGKELRRLKQSRGEHQGLTFSRDGKLLACAGPPFTVCIWETDTGRQFCSFKLTSEPIPFPENRRREVAGHLIAFSPDNRYGISRPDACLAIPRENLRDTLRLFSFLTAAVPIRSRSESTRLPLTATNRGWWLIPPFGTSPAARDCTVFREAR